MIRPARTVNAPSKTPHVAVVIPCYNYGHFLARCVDSVVTQPGVRTSVHIIDDASPDHSFSVAQWLSELHTNVRATRNSENLGHIATYNRALSEVDSDYVVLLSADDMLAPGSLSRATDLMEAHPSVGLVYGHPQSFETEPIGTDFPLLHWSIWPGRTWIASQFRRGLSIIYSPEAMVRTSVQHQVGYYRPDLPHSGDLEMWLRLASHADVGRVNGPDQAYRRIHPSSMMNSRFGGAVTDLQERRRAYEAYLHSANLEPRTSARLERTMRRRLSAEALGWAVDAGKDGGLTTEVFKSAEFAKEINPDYARLSAWREFEAMATSGLPPTGITAWNRYQRNLGDRIRWQRWRRLGI